MASDEPHEGPRRHVDRERAARTLTFWLRPEFLLRVINRFQKVAGFGRSIALALRGAHGAIIPLTIVASAVSTQLGGKGTAQARSRWDTQRQQLHERRHGRSRD